MAKSNPKHAETPGKKRKRPHPPSPSAEHEAAEEERRRSRTKLQSGGIWENLDLILSLQSRDLPPHRKIELAFNLVSSECVGRDRGPEPVQPPRLVSFLSDWVQPILISSDHGKKKSSDFSDPFLDYRVWVVLKFCLKKSPITVSPNLLRPITKVLIHFMSVSDGSDDSLSGEESTNLYGVVLECASLLFSSYGRTFSNAGVESWVSCSAAAVGLVLGIFSGDNPTPCSKDVFLHLSGLLLEQFVSFLRFHPSPKNVFRPFVDRLLEPLLEVLVLLHMQIGGGNHEDAGCLLTKVEDVLSNGLFHPFHISGFLSIRSSNLKQQAESKGTNESYHSHLFKRLKKITGEKKVVVMGGFGHLFLLFVTRARKKAGASMSYRSIHGLEKDNGTFEENLETSKQLFQVFIQFMEPLVVECKRYIEMEFYQVGEVSEANLIEVHCILKTVNEILQSFIHERIYARMDDTPEGTHCGCLKEVYDTVISVSGKVYLHWLSALDAHGTKLVAMLPLIAKELVLAIGYFLEIEYKVVGDDLARVWLMMMSYLAVFITTVETDHYFLLTSEISKVGCQMINIYSDLRQVNKPIFALCEAVRFFRFSDDGAEVHCTTFVSFRSLSSEACLKAVSMLLSSEAIRFATSNAIRSIPEGQASGCIQLLKMDVTESLEWLKNSFLRPNPKLSDEISIPNCNMPNLCMEAELLGILCEIYTVVLDSLTVTSSNSTLIGNSIKDLMLTIQPDFASLVQNQLNNIDDFYLSFTGTPFSNHWMSESETGLPTSKVDMSWVVIFFFRLYISCRSLYQQAISLMPPDSSRKAAAVMGISFTVSCGKDWVGRPDWVGGYFSWIDKKSHSLQAVIQFVSEVFLPKDIAVHAPLVYVLHSMSLQRLTDLNRQIKIFDFLQEKDERLAQTQLLDDVVHSHYRESRKRRRLIKVLKQEAADLTSFMTGYLPSLASKGKSISCPSDETGGGIEMMFKNKDAWDFGVCSLNEKSLPTAIWWLLCRNTDIWCPHAATKSLKKFLSLLFYHSMACFKSCSRDISMQSTKIPFGWRKVTMCHISLELLKDTVIYEQPVLVRHLTSRFFRLLRELLLRLLSHDFTSNIDIDSLPDWSEVLSRLEEGSSVGMDVEHDSHDDSSVMRSDAVSPNLSYLKGYKGRKSFPQINLELRLCQSLLNLLCQLPKVHVNPKSCTLCVTYILNLERHVVFNLLSCPGKLFLGNHYELLRLFVSCRRALKYLVMASVEENLGDKRSSLFSILCDSSFSILWLLKSVSKVVELPHAYFGDDYSSQVNEMFFLLMDNTSYLFLTLSVGQMYAAVPSQANDGKPHQESPAHAEATERNKSVKSKLNSDSSGHFDILKNLEVLAEILKEQTRNLLQTFKDNIFAKLETGVGAVNWNNLSTTVSCFQGISWALVSIVSSKDEKCFTENASELMLSRVSKLYSYINVFEDFINICLNMLLLDVQWPELLRREPNSTGVNHTYSFMDPSLCTADAFYMDERGNTSGSQLNIEEEGGRADHSVSHPDDDTEIFFLQHLKGSLLKSLLKGGNPDMAFLIRQLFMSSAAILKIRDIFSFSKALRLQVNHNHLLSSSMLLLVVTSDFVLSEMTEMVEILHPFTFVWLEGILKYLEVAGSYFSLTDSAMARNMYAKMINVHIRAIGKCIFLQGKAATLSFHETGSNTKMLQSGIEPWNNEVLSLDHGEQNLNEFKARLRLSFKNLIRRPFRSYLVSAVQALERVLVGVKQGYNMIYEVDTGDLDGGNVSARVAAGIDCFDLVLESVSGHKLLSVIKSRINNLIGALFNIILHLQNPVIFYRVTLPCREHKNGPDPGSVVLMCVEVLTKVAGRHSQFVMDPCHIGQCLHVPMTVFHDFHQIKAFRFSVSPEQRPLTDMHCDIDRQFCVNLYAACCRLLCTTLRHRKSEAENCIALLEDSVNILLVCLETVDADLVGQKGYFAWDIQEAVQCASFLRRIYEEVREQKDILGKYSSHFLSNYICIYSGYGPLKTGIKREIDEALRPGVYALVDICSDDDFQQIHTVLGEGPCRRTLATLRHDYQLNFQYEGKI